MVIDDHHNNTTHNYH